MATVLTEIPIIDAPWQTFAATLNNSRFFFTLFWNEQAGRWSFDLTINDEFVLAGRRIVTGINLLHPFNFGQGILVAHDPSGKDSQPDYANLATGVVVLYHEGEG
jgi:hypothetical protein